MNDKTIAISPLKPYPDELIVRDESGMWFHPDYSSYWDEIIGTGVEHCTDEEWEKLLVDLNIDTYILSIEEDQPELVVSENFKNGDLSAWIPNKPDLPGEWFLLLISDTEDGPAAWFAKTKDAIFLDAHEEQLPEEIMAIASQEDLLFIDAHATKAEVENLLKLNLANTITE